jgi:drug/metabolite transporter (DMT)-like permease
MSAGILLALFAAVTYGASDFLGGMGARRHSAWAIAFTGQLAGAAAILALAVVVPGSPVWADFAWAALAGLGGAVGVAFLYRGLASGRMGLVAPVSAVGAAVLPVTAGLALGERPSMLVWLGLAVALPGIWLVSREPVGSAGADFRRALLDGVIAGLGFGLLFIALAQVPASAGVLPLAANQLIGAAFTVIVARALRQAWRPRGGAIGWGVTAGVLGAAATASFLAASHATDLAVAAVLTSLYPAVTIALAAIVLRERINVTRGVGLVLCLACVGLVAAG